MNANLSRSQRSTVAKLKLGILPLQLEIGRWKDVALEERYYRLCQSGAIEDEFHFLMFCDKLKDVRTAMYLDLHEKTEVDLYGDKEVVLKELLHNDNIKAFARYVETMWLARKEVLFNMEDEEEVE